MFLYIKDYFLKKTFHVLLIIFCALLAFNSIMTLIDLKNYKLNFDYSRYHDSYELATPDGKLQVTVKRPAVSVTYDYATMPHKFTWVNGQLLAKNIEVASFTVEYKVYNGYVQDDKIKEYLVDTFTIKYKANKYPRITKNYEDEYVKFRFYIEMSVVDYDIKFNPRVYVPHIFVIAACVFFIVPSAVMLFKIRKEEIGG